MVTHTYYTTFEPQVRLTFESLTSHNMKCLPGRICRCKLNTLRSAGLRRFEFCICSIINGVIFFGLAFGFEMEYEEHEASFEVLPEKDSLSAALCIA